MRSEKVRKSFIDFFKKKNHSFIRSAPVVPIDDPTLLFNNAGMNQFKAIFLDEVSPESTRVVNSQKCIRVSGKHNDLEEVGLDTFHHTFFEMLGNWSFGDYYKKEAIQWAWELLTSVWKLDKERLWVTIYEDDDEAFDLWCSQTDIDNNRILRFGKKENFWEMGETGPCGPCSEIHYFIGNDLSSQNAKGVNKTNQYWELWNLVFIQNERLEDGTLVKLSKNHVDTGAGLERISCVLQGKTSNYETDLFMPIISEIEKISGIDYRSNQVPFQVIADHIRMLCFSIADGALPSNEGRGYVLRRILRRASRFGRILDLKEPFLYKLVPSVSKLMSHAFPELLEKDTHIELVIGTEETLFNQTLDRGINHLEKIIKNLDGDIISGTQAFKLYDTFGFPIDLTQLIAREHNIKVDQKRFEKEMLSQKNKAKKANKFRINTKSIDWIDCSEGNESEFIGYEFIESKSKVRKYAKINEKEILIILNKTPFYAEAGGQVGDKGTIKSDAVELEVIDVQKDNESIVHICRGMIKDLNKLDLVNCTVSEEYREPTKRNHTATHLLHAALKNVLGAQVQQAGSLVHPDYLRFDLTYFEKITKDQIREIEELVNSQIQLNRILDISIKPFNEAKKDGAIALFGEKYGDKVRVVSTGDFSTELCGGTHVSRTGDIGLFKIIEESSLASGVRRIVAVTGMRAIELFQERSEVLGKIQSQMNCAEDEITMRIASLGDEKKKVVRELKNLKMVNADDISKLILKGKAIDNHNIIIEELDVLDTDDLKNAGDKLLSILDSGIGVLLTAGTEKPIAVIVVTKDLISKGMSAGNLARKIGAIMGGGGGGKPHLATAGGQGNGQIKSIIPKIFDLIQKEI